MAGSSGRGPCRKVPHGDRLCECQENRHHWRILRRLHDSDGPGKTPDVWQRAGGELFGIIDWKTMLQHSDPSLQEYEKSLLGDPVKDVGVYERDSPIQFIHGVKAPLLVLQGDNDPRVPKEEAVQVVDLLKKDGKTVDAHYYPDEGHGFTKRENRIDSIRRSLESFDKYLKGGGA